MLLLREGRKHDILSGHRLSWKEGAPDVKAREYQYDNLRFLLIALVVLGHLLEIAGEFPHKETLYAVAVHAGTAGKEQSDANQKQRRRQNGEEEQTHPRAEHSTDLYLAELERVRETLRGGAYITVQAFTFLCFVVFQTSDSSVHKWNL